MRSSICLSCLVFPYSVNGRKESLTPSYRVSKAHRAENAEEVAIGDIELREKVPFELKERLVLKYHLLLSWTGPLGSTLN